MFIIKEVQSKSDSRKFTSFPNKLYKNNPNFVPALSIDEENVFNKKKNPAFEYCDVVRYLVYKDGIIVGRIAGIINRQLNEKSNQKVARFTRIDMIDDLEVTKVLLDTITKWAKSFKMEKLIGPMGFTDMDRMGMLCDGFDYLNMAITIYNAPYYHHHLEELGYSVDAEWLEMIIPWPKELPPKVPRVTEIVKSRYHYRLVKLTKKSEIALYAKKAFHTYNKAFMDLYGFDPLNDKMMDYYIKQVEAIVQFHYLWFVLNEEEEVIGFGIVMPSIARALKKSNGRLFPFGLFRILRALKHHDVIDFYFIAVDPYYQAKGVMSLIIEDGFYEGKKRNIKYALTGPQLITNEKIQNQWREYNPQVYKKRRSYFKNI